MSTTKPPIDAPAAPAPRSHLAVLGEKTAVPIVVAVAALAFGYGWRDHEAGKDSAVSDKITDLAKTVAEARAELSSKLDVLNEHIVAFQDKFREREATVDARFDAMRATDMTRDEFDAWARLLAATNPTVTVVQRAK